MTTATVSFQRQNSSSLSSSSSSSSSCDSSSSPSLPASSFGCSLSSSMELSDSSASPKAKSEPLRDEQQQEQVKVLVLGATTTIGRAAIRHLQYQPNVRVYAGISDPLHPLQGSDSFRRDIAPDSNPESNVHTMRIRMDKRTEMTRLMRTGGAEGQALGQVDEGSRTQDGFTREAKDSAKGPQVEMDLANEVSEGPRGLTGRLKSALRIRTPFTTAAVAPGGSSSVDEAKRAFFDRVLLVVPHYCPDGSRLIGEALRSCADAGIGFVSLIAADEYGDDSLFVKHYKPLEDLMKHLCEKNNASMQYSILRVPLLMDNLLGHAPSVRSQHILYDARIESKSFLPVAVDDVGKAAARVAGASQDVLEQHFGRTYRITGPETTTLQDICEYLTTKLEEAAIQRQREQEANQHHGFLRRRRHHRHNHHNHHHSYHQNHSHDQSHHNHHHIRFPRLRRQNGSHALPPPVSPTTVTYESFKEIFVLDQPQWMTDGIIQLCRFVNEDRPIMTQHSDDFAMITGGEAPTTIESWIDSHLDAFVSLEENEQAE